MTDDKIIAALKRGNDLLKEYEEIMKPVAKELAHRKSMMVFGTIGGYSGDLGCWEAGIDLICLHLADEFRNHPDHLDRYSRLEARDRTMDFEDMWRRKAEKEKVFKIHISGHF